MKLNVGFDDGLIKRYVERGRSPLFMIYWTQDQAAYPEDQWLDFGSVILSWWLVAAKSLLEGATEAELSFMDGPFGLRTRRAGSLLSISAENQSWQWRVPVEAFVAELLRAANQVQQKFFEMDIPDTDGLQIGIQQLKAALSQAKKMDSQNRALVAEAISL